MKGTLLALGALILCAAAPAQARPPELAGVPYVERGPASGPLVVVLHHQGGSPEETAALLATRLPTARLLVPASDPANGRHSWYTGSSAAARNESLRRATRRLAAFLAALPPGARPLVTGYSQGGIMALALAIERPQQIHKVIAVSGRVPTSLLAAIPSEGVRPAVVLLHGRADATISFQSGERSRDALARAGYTVELRPYPADGHGLSAQRLADWIAALALAH